MADPSSIPTAATYVDYKTFTVVGDCTDSCHTGRRIRARCGTSRVHGTIESAGYVGGLTTIILTEGSDDLVNTLDGIWIGQISGPGGYSSLPVHPHADDNSGGDTLEGDLSGGTWS